MEGQRTYTVTLEKQGEPSTDLTVTIIPAVDSGTAGKCQVNAYYFNVLLHKRGVILQLQEEV